MDSFINNVLLDLKNKNTVLSKCVFILPNKRSGYHLKKNLSHVISKTIFSPEIVSIESFIEDLSGLKLLSNTELIFEFYSVYLSITPKDKQEKFDDFIKWSRILIQDFNLIDKEIQNTNQVFDYLKAVKEMDHWSLDSNPTELVKRHLYFWGNIKAYYSEFSNHLLSIKSGYQGLLEKKALLNVSTFLKNKNDLKYIFVGFNALNKVESLVIQEFLKIGLADIYWDIDKISINSTFNNSAFFINQYRNNWPYYKGKEINWINDNYCLKKNINAIGISKNIGQVKYIGEIIKKNIDKTEKTAIVLGDESLLIPMLNSLPKGIKDVNITMGFPLFSSSVSSLFYKLFKLHTNTEGSFYYKEVVSLLSHELIKPLFDNNGINYSDLIIEKINKGNIVNVKLDFLINNSKINKTLTELLFKNWSNNVENAISNCKKVIIIIRDSLLVKEDQGVLTVEHLYRFNEIFNELLVLKKRFNFINSIKLLFDLFQDIVKNERLKFNSESFSKIQIMGLLESRVLDFDTVIISSVNEGVLPSGNTENSFIPFDVKIDNNIPTYKEQDAIYSYHFYRLIQRAKNVYLIYNTEADSLKGGEKSRFIRQIEFEGIHKINHKIISSYTPKNKEKLIEITKTDEIINDLNILSKKGFSASSILSYIREPLTFYYKKILKITDEIKVEETIESNTLGTVIHEVLKEIYNPLLNKFLTEDYLKIELKQLDKIVKSQFEIIYKNGQFKTGKNLIILEVAKKYISEFIKIEIESIKQGDKIQIIGIEEDFNVKFKSSKFKEEINLKGQIDRIDNLNGTLRIIDYKTGKKIEKRELNISNWENIEIDYSKVKNWFQLLFYAYAYNLSNKQSLPIEAGIISFKSLKSGLLKFNFGTRFDNTSIISEEVLENYKIILENILTEIMNPNINFVEKKLQ
ncbi:PD-(D/E)XK nuclease family protein [Flavobacteriaceae bacterium]|nr:PD-(D/E)XK nuclease family protein [Flavobacteriaceae bacterium]MDC1492083.1 PD-(D/E)XK nuclease family protein [Flavobacteriaceae bacterium]